MKIALLITAFLNNNITIFISGFVAIVALSMGLGTRSIAANLVAGYYIRKLFKEGQEVVLCGVKGKIKRINNINVVIEAESEELAVPNNEIIEWGYPFDWTSPNM